MFVIFIQSVQRPDTDFLDQKAAYEVYIDKFARIFN